MTETKLCRACGKANDLSSAVCQYCKTPFMAMIVSQTTSHVAPPEPNKQFMPARVVQLTSLYADLLVFQIANYEQPLLVKVSEKDVTIGRYSPGETPPTVDLTPFNGSLMGVSRKHALIKKEDNGYKIIDLASTNGTWVNEKKLDPNVFHTLQSGDIVRLGQINTSVYFRLSQPQTPGEITLVFENDSASSPLNLSVSTLELSLLPYIKALEHFQRFCDDIMLHSTSEVTISSIVKDPNKAQITVKITGLFQSYRLLRINIARWREVHYETIVKLQQDRPSKIPDWASEQSSPDTPPNNPEHYNTLRAAAIELAQEMLTDLAPHRTREENQASIPKLLPLIQRLAISPIRLVPSST